MWVGLAPGIARAYRPRENKNRNGDPAGSADQESSLLLERDCERTKNEKGKQTPCSFGWLLVAGAVFF
jgi:hypothetical protein